MYIISHLYPSLPDRTSHHLSETVNKCLLEQYLKVCQSVVLMMKRVTALWGVCQACVRLRGVNAGWLCCDSERQRLWRLLPPMLPVAWWETERLQWWWITELISVTWETRQSVGREKRCGAAVCDNTLVDGCALDEAWLDEDKFSWEALDISVHFVMFKIVQVCLWNVLASKECSNFVFV